MKDFRHGNCMVLLFIYLILFKYRKVLLLGYFICYKAIMIQINNKISTMTYLQINIMNELYSLKIHLYK